MPIQWFEHTAIPRGVLNESRVNYTAFVPNLHQHLQNPDAVVLFPRMPSIGSTPELGNLWPWMYWEPACHLLYLLLGWTDPAKGLLWWYHAGKPTDEPLLGAFKELWDYEGQSDLLAGFLWIASMHKWSVGDDGLLKEVPGCKIAKARPEASDPGMKWWRAFREKYPETGDIRLPICPWQCPEDASGNNLHLSQVVIDACNLPQKEDALLLHTDAKARRGTFISENIRGWYRQLAEHGKVLPILGEHSWHIDVVVKSVGYLGTFRRSRVTGLWFQGKHSIHEKGN